MSNETSGNSGSSRRRTAAKNPKTVLPDPKSVQKAVDQISSTLNNPEYKDQLTRLTQLSVNNAVQTAQRLSKVAARMSQMDSEEMTEAVSSSVGDMMRLYLQFNSDLLTLMIKVSNQAIEILEKAPPAPTGE